MYSPVRFEPAILIIANIIAGCSFSGGAVMFLLALRLWFSKLAGPGTSVRWLSAVALLFIAFGLALPGIVIWLTIPLEQVHLF